MVKKLSCVSHGSLKRFPHTFTNVGETSWQATLVIVHNLGTTFLEDGIRGDKIVVIRVGTATWVLRTSSSFFLIFIASAATSGQFVDQDTCFG